MKFLVILFLSAQVFASDNYKESEDRYVFVGPSFKIWCSLTSKAKERVGSKLETGEGNLVLFPKTNGTGHLPQLIARDFSSEKQLKEFFKDLGQYCEGSSKELLSFLNSKLDTWKKHKISMVNVRAFDEILWEFYSDRTKEDLKKNKCTIRQAQKIATSWLLSYPELNKTCL